METTWIFWLDAVVIGFLAAIFFALPRLQRRGLLFGVYVGERTAATEEAREIVRFWDRRLAAWTVFSLVIGAGATVAFGPTWTAIAAIVPLMLGVVATYLAAHRRAHAIAPEIEPPPPAVASLEAERPGDLLVPLLTLAFGVLCGLVAVAYAAVHYPEMPARVPTHFGPSGAPDAWSEKSVLSVMLLPFTTLGLGTLIGVMTLLTARAKRAFRRGGSPRAHLAFRRAVTRYLAAVGVICDLHLLALSIAAVRAALGRTQGLPGWLLWSTVILVVVAVIGGAYLAVRYGQGGGLAEARAGEADRPLTDGLADDRFWKAGIFYVNPDDPSIMVEKRFGLGYTVNFGNPWGIAIMVGLLLFVVAVTVAAFLI